MLANALINAANAGYDTVFHVHDEIICEVPSGYGSVDELCKLMCIKPEWADGLPLNADGFEYEYYKKGITKMQKKINLKGYDYENKMFG